MKLDDLQGKKVLVTGGTGFLGGRLVERLVLELGAHVTVLVRNYGKAMRIARFDAVRRVSGDFTDRAAVLKAAEGCTYIFHCAHYMPGTFPRHNLRQNLRGAANVADAAIQYGARLVYISSVDFYGLPDVETLNESSPQVSGGNFYAKAKRQVEEYLLGRYRTQRLLVSILQPTVIYGPYAGWTIGTCAQLRNGHVVLPNNGKGCCNPVHVDDVIDAMLLAATKETAIGERFLISGPESISWDSWFQRHEELIGVKATMCVTNDEFKQMSSQEAKRRNLVPVLKSIFTGGTAFMLLKHFMRARVGEACIKGPIKILGDILFALPGCEHWDQSAKRVVRKLRTRAALTSRTDVIHNNIIIPDRWIARLYASQANVSIDKARNLLGYAPCYSIDKGMEASAAFIRWAHL